MADPISERRPGDYLRAINEAVARFRTATPPELMIDRFDVNPDRLALRWFRRASDLPAVPGSGSAYLGDLIGIPIVINPLVPSGYLMYVDPKTQTPVFVDLRSKQQDERKTEDE
jgi:hypothetical protein